MAKIRRGNTSDDGGGPIQFLQKFRSGGKLNGDKHSGHAPSLDRLLMKQY